MLQIAYSIFSFIHQRLLFKHFLENFSLLSSF